MSKIALYILCSILMFSCNSDGKIQFSVEKNNAFKPIETETLLEDRSSWQKPEWIIKEMGDIENKTIADIGSGTGYFTYRFALKEANVIAIDIDPDAINLIKLFKENLPKVISEKIETRLAETDDPKIKTGEVDYIFISNTVAYIEDLQRYLSIIKEGLKDGGKLVIIDFKMDVEDEFAPPQNERLSIEELSNTIQSAGYNIVESDNHSLLYQYFIIAEPNEK